jgi:hypothetical protein
MKRVFVEEEIGTEDADLGISRVKIDGIIAHARIFDAREANSDPNSGSNPSDDGVAGILEDTGSDSVRRELVQLIRDMDVDEQVSLVALAWIGRGTYSAREWDDAVMEARRAHNNHTAEYLLALPLLGNYLENGLAELDRVTAATAARRLT